MKVDEIRVCVLKMEGTNCEKETFDAFSRLGASPEFVHIKQLEGRVTGAGERKALEDYHILMLPGGFSGGDYIRAGAIFASRIKASVGKDLVEMIESGKGIGGFCNGFQIMVELGILPDLEGSMSAQPTAVLHSNDSGRFECRPVLLKNVGKGRCAWTGKVPHGEVRLFPVAHAEGNLILGTQDPEKAYERLFEGDMVVMRYCDRTGDTDAPYPFNPNGSRYNVAGICNSYGNVFGMMPHPERVFFRHTHPDWYRRRISPVEGDGRIIFDSILQYISRRF